VDTRVCPVNATATTTAIAGKDADMTAFVRLMGWMLLISLLIWAVMIIAGYALVVAVVGGIWALKEANAKRAGRPFVEPSQRFLSVWTRAISPIDRKNWITPAQRPATDPALLPGSSTGRLRIEHTSTERVPSEQAQEAQEAQEAIVVHARLHNHATRTIEFGNLDDVDFQLWTPEGTVVGADTVWSEKRLAPGQSLDLGITTTVVTGQALDQWAISYRAEGAPYAFFDVARPIAHLSQENI
jgi:hypothetical protein